MALELMELLIVAVAGPLLLKLGTSMRLSPVGRALLVVTPALFAAAAAFEGVRWVAIEQVGRPEFYPLPASESRAYAVFLSPSWRQHLPQAGVVFERRLESAVPLSIELLGKAQAKLNGRRVGANLSLGATATEVRLEESVDVTVPLVFEYVVTDENRPLFESSQIRVHPAGPLKGFRQSWTQKLWVLGISAILSAVWCVVGLILLPRALGTPPTPPSLGSHLG